MTTLSEPRTLPGFREALAGVTEAEQAEGWLARCHDSGRHLVPTREMTAALAAVIRTLTSGPVLEICAGDGSLSRALRSVGVEVDATDIRPGGSDVGRYTAGEALHQHRHPVVLGSFVPVDAGIDRRVLTAPHVRHYLVLGAKLGPEPSARVLAAAGWGWRRVHLPGVSRWMVTRHDVWLGHHLPILRRGDAWLLSRATPGPEQS